MKGLYTPQRHYIGNDVTHFNDMCSAVQVEIHKDTDLDEGGGGRVGNSASYLKKTQIKHIYSKLIR